MVLETVRNVLRGEGRILGRLYRLRGGGGGGRVGVGKEVEEKVEEDGAEEVEEEGAEEVEEEGAEEEVKYECIGLMFFIFGSLTGPSSVCVLVLVSATHTLSLSAFSRAVTACD